MSSEIKASIIVIVILFISACLIGAAVSGCSGTSIGFYKPREQHRYVMLEEEQFTQLITVLQQIAAKGETNDTQNR